MGQISSPVDLDEAQGTLLISREQGVSRESFIKFVEANPDLRTELTAQGEMIVMAPAHSRTGNQNFKITAQLAVWAIRDGHGEGFDSSTGYDLPDGSNRSPDASWVTHSRLAMLSPKERESYLPLCPDFVVELRSKSDSVRSLRQKMTEYIANGSQLGWLIDPVKRTVHIFRPHRPIEILNDPSEVSADPELPGFILDLYPIFNPNF